MGERPARADSAAGTVRDLTPERIGTIAAGAAACLFGASYPATAVALRSFTPIATGGLQALVGLTMICALAVAGGLPRPQWSVPGAPPGRWLRIVILAALGGTGFIVAMNLAVSLSGPTITGFVAVLYAVLSTVLAVPLLGERAGPWTVLAFVLACAGALLLIGTGVLTSSVEGIVAGLTGALLYGLYLVLGRRWIARYSLDAVSVTLAVLVARGPLLLGLELVRGGTVLPAAPRADALLALAFLSLGPSMASQLLVLVSMRRVRAGRTAAALLLTPITSAVIAVGLLGDGLTVPELGGAILILCAIVAAVQATRSKPDPVPT